MPLLYLIHAALKSLLGNAGDTRAVGLIPGSGRPPGVGNGNPFQYFCLENPVDRGNWQSIVHGAIRAYHDLATEHAHTQI